MSYKLKIQKDYYEENEVIFRTNQFIFHPGVTILIGCNGAGKTTLLKELDRQLGRDNKATKFLRYDQERERKNSLMEYGNVSPQRFMSWVTCSEGEQIRIRLEDFAMELGQMERTHPDEDLYILVDGLDSGFSIDNIVDLRQQLFRFLIDRFQSMPNDIYIICSANSYEMAAGYDCVNAISGEHENFNNYERYKELIMKTREWKDERYK